MTEHNPVPPPVPPPVPKPHSEAAIEPARPSSPASTLPSQALPTGSVPVEKVPNDGASMPQTGELKIGGEENLHRNAEGDTIAGGEYANRDNMTTVVSAEDAAAGLGTGATPGVRPIENVATPNVQPGERLSDAAAAYVTPEEAAATDRAGYSTQDGAEVPSRFVNPWTDEKVSDVVRHQVVVVDGVQEASFARDLVLPSDAGERESLIKRCLSDMSGNPDITVPAGKVDEIKTVGDLIQSLCQIAEEQDPAHPINSGAGS